MQVCACCRKNGSGVEEEELVLKKKVVFRKVASSLRLQPGEGGLPAYILQGGTNLSAQASLVCPGSESSTVHTHEGWRERWESNALTQALSPFFQWSPTHTVTNAHTHTVTNARTHSDKRTVTNAHTHTVTNAQ